MIIQDIKDHTLNQQLCSIEPDGMSVFVMAEGRVRGALFNGTRFVNTMRAQHNLGILETMVLGQACLCGALMIPTLKGRGREVIKYDTNGPAAGFSVEIDSAGFVRGFLLQNPIPVSAPLENWDLSPFLGPGTLSVTQMIEGMKTPYTSSVEISNQNIAQDLAWYFLQSEQVNTAFNTSIQMDKEGRVIGAGGLFLQIMPEAGGKAKKSGAQVESKSKKIDDAELLRKVENAFKAAPSLGQWFSEGGNREDIIYGLFREFEPTVAVDRNIVFNCPCSEEVFRNHVRHMPASEIEDIKKNGPNPLVLTCHNCGSVYTIPVETL